MREITLENARNAKRESKYVEFKEKFDVNEPQDWCEIIKDIAAMANSGGGWILVGLKNDGSPSGADVSQVLRLDPAQVTDKIGKYTGEEFSDFEVHETDKNGSRIAALEILGTAIPLIFTQPGNYDIGGGKQKSAFTRGAVYFRHGAKSEPGNSKDLRDCISREIEKVRKLWLGNIRKVVTAPTGYKVNLLPPEIVESSTPSATPIRITDDPSAPVYRKIDPNHTHPHRQKEVVQKVNDKIGDRKKISSHDILCVRKVHGINDRKANFYYKPKFASPQYSDGFIDWVVQQFEGDPDFFDKARQECKKTST